MNLLKSDSFSNDAEGWIANQLSHALLGMFFYTVVVTALFIHLGEYPKKVVPWAIVLAGYLIWEFAIQRGGIFWDSLEDTIFVAGYGAGILALGFGEIEAGSPKFIACLFDVLPVIALFAFHCVVGVILRLKRPKSE
jgi:hypothetical protein